MKGLAFALRSGAAAFAVAALLGACSKPAVVPPKPDPTVLAVGMTAAGKVNVDPRGRPSPVVLRIYVLNNASAFEASDFFSLFDRDKQVLGEAVVSREEVVLKPGERRVLEPRELEEGRLVAVFAAFREVDSAVWRASAPLVANRRNEIEIGVQDNRLSVSARLAPLPPPPAKAN